MVHPLRGHFYPTSVIDEGDALGGLWNMELCWVNATGS
jgi:hypothetical protein